MFKKLYQKYMELITNPYPSKSWKIIRFFLHWFSLPLKLVLIGGLGLYDILIINQFTEKVRNVPKHDPASRKGKFLKVWNRLPVYHSERYELYTNRVPAYQQPDLMNHNTDHQLSRHGTYHFIMERLGRLNGKIMAATSKHMSGQWLSRGYKLNSYTGDMEFNAGTTSGDMLVGLCLALTGTINQKEKYEKSLADILKVQGHLNTLQDFPGLESFEKLMSKVIENDYALLEGANPGKDNILAEVYQKELQKMNFDQTEVRMKSQRAMWQPGLETVGAQALTILAALKLATKLGNTQAKKEYNKLFWGYGYGLLSLFPTAFIPSKRGYFNDHNCMVALYILSKYSTNFVEKSIYWFAMTYVWLLSKNWHNAYFTGLYKEVYPFMVSKAYIEKCKDFLYETDVEAYSYMNCPNITLKEVPIEQKYLDYDEFSPDVGQNKQRVSFDEKNKIRSGLGYVASVIILEETDTVKEFFW